MALSQPGPQGYQVGCLHLGSQGSLCRHLVILHTSHSASPVFIFEANKCHLTSTHWDRPGRSRGSKLRPNLSQILFVQSDPAPTERTLCMGSRVCKGRDPDSVFLCDDVRAVSGGLQEAGVLPLSAEQRVFSWVLQNWEVRLTLKAAR
jgi:hypothetical protein